MVLFLTGQYSCITSEENSTMAPDNQIVFLFFLCLLFEHFYTYILLVEINAQLKQPQWKQKEENTKLITKTRQNKKTQQN